MDIKGLLTQCAQVDNVDKHRCPGRINKFYPNGDNMVCDCPCHEKKVLVPA